MIDTPAQGMSAGTDETLEAAQGEARQPGPKDAPGTQANPTPTDVNTLIERLLGFQAPEEFKDFADLMVEEIIAGFRAKISDKSLSPDEQSDLLNVAIGYRDKCVGNRETMREAAQALRAMQARVGEWCQMNLNDLVRVKYTAHGIACLRADHDALNEFVGGALSDFKPPKTDDDGWSETQLWVLMADIGKHTTMGRPLPIETTIHLRARSTQQEVQRHGE